tara:strand:- start:3214 stop:4365 length:1152 start_codon:yes stop_codon:yes gene_type:complete
MGLKISKKKIYNNIFNIEDNSMNNLLKFVLSNNRDEIYNFILDNKLFNYNYKYLTKDIYVKLNNLDFYNKNYDYHSIILPNNNIVIYGNNNKGILDYESSTNSIFNGILLNNKLEKLKHIIVRQMNYYLEKDDKIDFILENIIHILLYNYYDKFISQLKFKINIKEKIIPPIYYVGTSNFNNYKNNLISIMPYLGNTLFETINSCNLSKYNLYDIFFQICFHLKILQIMSGFMHRDLHAGNILVHKRDKHDIISYNFNNNNIKIKSEYKVYFIDFGQSCIDLSLCNKCDIKNKIFTKTTSYNYDEKKKNILISCENNSHDLRILFSSLYDTIKYNKELSELVLYFKDSIITRLEFVKVYRLLNVYDSLFDPDNLLYLITKHFK